MLHEPWSGKVCKMSECSYGHRVAKKRNVCGEFAVYLDFSCGRAYKSYFAGSVIVDDSSLLLGKSGAYP